MNKRREIYMSMDPYKKLSENLTDLLDNNPLEAVKKAHQIDLNNKKENDRVNLLNLKASIFINGGKLIQQKNIVEEGLLIFRELYKLYPENPQFLYNLANGIAELMSLSNLDLSWLDYKEKTKIYRTEARESFWKVANNKNADFSIRTQAWTNLANQFNASYRFGEACDAWLAGLDVDFKNGVAAGSAALCLLRLYEHGVASELTYIEIVRLANIARKYKDRVIQYVGINAAEKIFSLANNLNDPPSRLPVEDPFMCWLEKERLVLAPTIDMIDPTLDKLDWLGLPSILDRELDKSGMPPPIFAMFNMLKSDFILARDLAWKASCEDVSASTGKFASTNDFAIYGEEASLLILAHRTALDLLDKVAVIANHYFKLGKSVDSIYFGKLWRVGDIKNNDGVRPLTPTVDAIIRKGVYALYGLVELAEDYYSDSGILRSQKNLRNAGTHRFVVLHLLGDINHARKTPEIERHLQEDFNYEVMCALRVARSAIQMLALAISQHEQILQKDIEGPIGQLPTADY